MMRGFGFFIDRVLVFLNFPKARICRMLSQVINTVGFNIEMKHGLRGIYRTVVNILAMMKPLY